MRVFFNILCHMLTSLTEILPCEWCEFSCRVATIHLNFINLYFPLENVLLFGKENCRIFSNIFKVMVQLPGGTPMLVIRNKLIILKFAPLLNIQILLYYFIPVYHILSGFGICFRAQNRLLLEILSEIS